MLTSNEKRLCCSLRLHPCLYITYKERGGTKKTSHWGGGGSRLSVEGSVPDTDLNPVDPKLIGLLEPDK
jgi:hypothetical protein